jgi:hypothetical protein
VVSCFPGVSIVAAKEFGIDYPSMLSQNFIAAGGTGIVTLHAMHSVVDWFAFARWANGKLLRSLSLSPDSGILEDIGKRCRSKSPTGLASTRRSAKKTKKRTALTPSRFTHWNLVRQPWASYSDITLRTISIPRCLTLFPFPWFDTSVPFDMPTWVCVEDLDFPAATTCASGATCRAIAGLPKSRTLP